MPAVASYSKYTQERRRLYIDYSCWLEETEELTNFQVQVAPYTAEAPLWIDTAYTDAEHKKLVIFAQGGVANETYTCRMVITTDEGQIKRDDIRIKVIA